MSEKKLEPLNAVKTSWNHQMKLWKIPVDICNKGDHQASTTPAISFSLSTI